MTPVVGSLFSPMIVTGFFDGSMPAPWTWTFWGWPSFDSVSYADGLSRRIVLVGCPWPSALPVKVSVPKKAYAVPGFEVAIGLDRMRVEFASGCALIRWNCTVVPVGTPAPLINVPGVF